MFTMSLCSVYNNASIWTEVVNRWTASVALKSQSAETHVEEIQRSTFAQLTSFGWMFFINGPFYWTFCWKYTVCGS